MTPPEGAQNKAETRQQIDEKLIAASWAIQGKSCLNLYESLGVAIREMAPNGAKLIEKCLWDALPGTATKEETVKAKK